MIAVGRGKAGDEAGGAVVEQEEMTDFGAPVRAETQGKASLKAVSIFLVEFLQGEVGKARLSRIEKIDIDQQIIKLAVKLELMLDPGLDLQKGLPDEFVTVALKGRLFPRRHRQRRQEAAIGFAEDIAFAAGIKRLRHFHAADKAVVIDLAV